MSKSKKGWLKITEEDFERETYTDYSAEEAVRDYIFWVFRCKANYINIDRAIKIGNSIARETENGIMDAMMTDIAKNVINGKSTLNKEQIDDLKENGLYDEFLEKVETLRKSKKED